MLTFCYILKTVYQIFRCQQLTVIANNLKRHSIQHQPFLVLPNKKKSDLNDWHVIGSTSILYKIYNNFEYPLYPKLPSSFHPVHLTRITWRCMSVLWHLCPIVLDVLNALFHQLLTSGINKLDCIKKRMNINLYFSLC